MKNGIRLQSQVDQTQVIVVRATDSLEDLRCGGLPMIGFGDHHPGAAISTEFAGGNQIGKRYVDDSGAEILVTKAGAGTLCIGSTPLAVKDAKPLPASD